VFSVSTYVSGEDTIGIYSKDNPLENHGQTKKIETIKKMQNSKLVKRANRSDLLLIGPSYLMSRIDQM
jgi:hypothetical protein